MDKEQDILQEAVRQLRELTEDAVRIELTQGPDDRGADGVLQVDVDGSAHRFVLKVKPTLTKSTAGIALNQNDQVTGPLLFVSERIAASVADVLSRGGANYLDAVGNCYICDGPLFICIRGRKAGKTFEQQPTKAFREAGLRLIFNILYDERVASHTYRDLAKMAGISRGAVGYVMSDLQKLGYILEARRGHRTVMNREELLQKWVSGYSEILRPKLMLGRFRFADDTRRRKWRDVSLEAIDGVWGGEPAASILTNYLKPEIFTVYTNASRREIVEMTGLLPDEHGEIEVLRRFWDGELTDSGTSHAPVTLAPKLVVYADLIDSADTRNLETAGLLCEDLIQDVPGSEH